MITNIVNILFLAKTVNNDGPGISRVGISGFINVSCARNILRRTGVNGCALTRPIRVRGNRCPTNIIFGRSPPTSSLVGRGNALALCIDVNSHLRGIPSVARKRGIGEIHSHLASTKFGVLRIRRDDRAIGTNGTVHLRPGPNASTRCNSRVGLCVDANGPPIRPVSVPGVVNLRFNSTHSHLMTTNFRTDHVGRRGIGSGTSTNAMVSTAPSRAISRLPSMSVALAIDAKYRSIAIAVAVPSRGGISMSIRFCVSGGLGARLSRSKVLLGGSNSALHFALARAGSRCSIAIVITRRNGGGFIPCTRFGIGTVGNACARGCRGCPPTDGSAATTSTSAAAATGAAAGTAGARRG